MVSAFAYLISSMSHCQRWAIIYCVYYYHLNFSLARVILLDFFNEKLTKSWYLHITFLFKRKHYRSVCKDFLLLIADWRKERMIKCFIDCDSLSRVNNKCLIQEINAFRRCSREEIFEIDSLLLLEALQVLNSLLISDEIHVVLIRCSKH